MARSLSSTDVLLRDRRAQRVVLADGRWLIRHRSGLSLLAGIGEDDLEVVLAEVDGRRSVAEIVGALASRYEEEDLRRLFDRLSGEGLDAAPPVSPSPAPELGRRLRIVGRGAAAKRLVAALAVADNVVCESSAELEGKLEDPESSIELIVCVVAQMPYREALAVQRIALDKGLWSLYLSVDGDGVRVGPSVLPGIAPCFFCAQMASFASLRLAPGDLLAALARMTTSELIGADAERALAELEREARALLSPGGRPRVLGKVSRYLAAGGATHEVERREECPLCRDSGPSERFSLRQVSAWLADEERRGPRVRTVTAAASANHLCRRIGIVGGGTAGYLTALALRRKQPEVEVSLIESSALPIIGVGEATTPLMPQFLHADLGFGVAELFREVRPTLKLGIRFEWGEPGGWFHYPFGPLQVLEPMVYGGDVRNCSLRSMMMAADVVPIGDRGELSQLDTEIAYHLDNERFVAYLRRKALELGVRRIDARIREVRLSEDGGDVRELIADDGRRFAFDLYVDCSGFRSLLLGDALASPFVSFADSLPTDQAIVAAVPHGGRVRPYTVAETMAAGWCWSTPQVDADHRGYVFCSAFLTPAAAAAEMRAKNPGMGEWRQVRFRCGRRRHFWKGNVVAMGNAYGFVEPLESTALHMLIRQIGLLVGAFPIAAGMRGLADLYNRQIAAFWDYLRWFLALHYKFNRRLDTAFWRHCREAIDLDAHGELLTIFHERGPLSYDAAAVRAFDYPDPLWGPEGIDVLLLGQGVRGHLPRPALSRRRWQQRLGLRRRLVAGALPQASALAQLVERPELAAHFEQMFRRRGPAFPVQGPS